MLLRGSEVSTIFFWLVRPNFPYKTKFENPAIHENVKFTRLL